MSTINHAVVNLFLVHGFIRNDELMNYLQILKDDYHLDMKTVSLSVIFRAINDESRRFGFEIRSVNLQSEDNERVLYHGLCNTDEDDVARDFGSPFQTLELKYFAQIATRLLEDKTLSMRDIVDMRHDKLSKEEAQLIVGRLLSMGWLRRDDAGYFILGVRSYLELRSYFEGILNIERADKGGSNAAAISTHLDKLMEDMPQILMY
jgi:hypothetical protein